MPTYEPWSVVVVPFPFTERLRSKRRPAVVLSPAAFQNTHGCSVLAMVTDARNPRWASDVVLGDLDAAGLSFASVFRCKLFTLDHGLIVRAIGRLSASDRRAASRALRAAIS